MKLKFYSITIMLFVCIVTARAGETYLRNWSSVLQQAGITHQSLYEMCPHFPRFEDQKTDEGFGLAVREWSTKFPAEWSTFMSQPGVRASNPAVYYLGIEADPNHSHEFENGWWEWVKGSNISEERLKMVAPHFPKPVVSGDKQKDQTAYDLQIERWRTLYSHEYEALLNAPELTKLNPDYAGYIDAIKIPYYVKGLTSTEMPVMKNTGDAFRDEMNYQLDLQTWYFIFKPEAFEATFGFPIQHDPAFDAMKFRERVKERIERQRKLAAGEIREEDLMKEETEKKNRKQ